MLCYARGMKHRSTTPVSSRRHVAKSSIVAAAVLMSASIPVAFAQNVLADQYDEQVKKLQSEADSYQQQAATLGALASTLQAQLDVLTKQKMKSKRKLILAKLSAISLRKISLLPKRKSRLTKKLLAKLLPICTLIAQSRRSRCWLAAKTSAITLTSKNTARQCRTI